MAETTYDTYAAIYDVARQGRFGEALAAWALGWLAERAAPPSRVLDLACGTGAATLRFAAAGCAAFGLDRSEAMLDVAQARARDARTNAAFALGDIREIGAHPALTDWLASAESPSCELVTCFADSLNYLLDDGDLDRVFAGAAAVLARDGFLMFDLNTEAEYATWDERDTIAYDDNAHLVYHRLDYAPEQRIATGRIVWFVREIDLWWRGEETHYQRAWSDTDVCNALAKAGFALTQRYDPTSGTMQEATAEARRVVYIARKIVG